MRTTLVPILVLLAILANAKAFDAKTVMRLVATVDPKTCNCISNDLCRIEVPYATFIGIDCGALKLCCHPRKRVKAFVTPRDMAELHQAAKRFNVEDQIQDIVRTADPAKIDSTLEELKNNNEELFDINDNDKELVENKEKTLQDTCQCLLPETCPQ